MGVGLEMCGSGKYKERYTGAGSRLDIRHLKQAKQEISNQKMHHTGVPLVISTLNCNIQRTLTLVNLMYLLLTASRAI